MSDSNPLKMIVEEKPRLPSWLHRKLPPGNFLFKTASTITKNRLHTVCEEAKCPNLVECYSHKTATFLVLGKSCTRACGFCEIDFSKTPPQPDPEEPFHVAQSVQELGLKHVVITMVARDDLPDGGAKHLVQVVTEVRNLCKGVTIETLTSDFDGNESSLQTLLQISPEIFNHNIETVRRLTPKVRFRATYERSLATLHFAKKYNPTLFVKSGLMVGLGETKEEIVETLQDLANNKCDIVTIGQYLQASSKRLVVKEYIHPTVFEEYAKIGQDLGISYVYAGPFVRSSYNAGVVFKNITITST